MTDNNTAAPNFKSLSAVAGDIDSKLLNTPITQHFAAAGDVNNDKLKTCNICRQNGWSHEAITIEPINGRIKSDGTNEVKAWRIRDYFNGREHTHREPITEGAST